MHPVTCSFSHCICDVIIDYIIRLDIATGINIALSGHFAVSNCRDWQQLLAIVS